MLSSVSMPSRQLRGAGRERAVGAGEAFGARRRLRRSRPRAAADPLAAWAMPVCSCLAPLPARPVSLPSRLAPAWARPVSLASRLAPAWARRGFAAPVAWRRHAALARLARPALRAPLSARPAPSPSELAPAAAEARPPRSSRDAVACAAQSRAQALDPALGAFQALRARTRARRGLRRACAARPATDAGPSTAATSGSRAIASCQCISARRRCGVVIAPLLGACDDHERRRPPRSDRAFDHPHRDTRRARGGKLRRVRRAHAQRAGGGRQREHPGEDQRDRDRGVRDQPFRQASRSAAPPGGARSG